MIDNNRLQDLAEKAGRVAGWDGPIYAVWFSSPRFSCLWRRYGQDLVLKLCDWMQDAPEGIVLEALVRTVMAVQRAKLPPASEEFRTWTDANRHRWTPDA